MNRESIHRPVGRTRAAIAIGLLCAASISARAEEVTVARYSTRVAEPSIEQRDPLAAMVTLTFPSAVTTLQQAVEALLQPAGYRLAAASAAAPERDQLLALPLPETLRTLGPVSLRLALATVVPPGFAVIEDPAHRLVTFERCAAHVAEK